MSTTENVAERPAVHVCGGDQAGWAVDEDYRLATEALSALIRPVSPAEAAVVHSVWWFPLVSQQAMALAGKRIICHATADPDYMLGDPKFALALDRVGLWLARSEGAAAKLTRYGLPNRLLPYVVDQQVFRPLEAASDVTARRAARQRWGVPEEAYLIGSFQRDSEGADRQRPKLVKGPDLYAELLAELVREGLPVHAVLAGPRRHWLRGRLAELGVPFTFVGESTDGDDYPQNAVPREQLNELYNLLDLTLVTSRFEGGPHAVMEAAAAGCKILSSRVGQAPDLLDPACLFRDAAEALEQIRRDVEGGVLDSTRAGNQERVAARCSLAAAREHLAAVYAELESVPVYQPSAAGVRPTPQVPPRWRRGVQRVLRRLRPRPEGDGLRVGIWHTFHKPPWGGGNQFMMALCHGLEQRGVEIIANKYSERVNVWLLNAVQFDIPRFQKFYERHPVGVVHRLDGLFQLTRGKDGHLDEQVYQINRAVATFSIVQSAYILREAADLGYHPMRPVLIHNTVNPEVFNATGRAPLRAEGGKIRIVGTSWSDNPRKGGPIYRWMDQHLDFDRFEFTFLGNVSEPLENIQILPPRPSEGVAELLRSADVYITASRHDPCSNAVVEALACGLPVLYLDHGGTPELVQYGGVPFTGTDDVLPALDRLVAHLPLYQALRTPPGFDEVVDRYLAVLRQAAR